MTVEGINLKQDYITVQFIRFTKMFKVTNFN
jgi:hypothetical protein